MDFLHNRKAPEMRQVFLDTNTLMDAVEYRTHCAESNTLLDMSRCPLITIYATTTSFTTMSYLLRHYTPKELHRIFANLVDALDMVPVNNDAFSIAMEYGPEKDFEYPLQYQCDLAAGCDAIISNNKSDFAEFSQPPLMTAEEFLLQFEDSPRL